MRDLGRRAIIIKCSKWQVEFCCQVSSFVSCWRCGLPMLEARNHWNEEYYEVCNEWNEKRRKSMNCRRWLSWISSSWSFCGMNKKQAKAFLREKEALLLRFFIQLFMFWQQLLWPVWPNTSQTSIFGVLWSQQSHATTGGENQCWKISWSYECNCEKASWKWKDIDEFFASFCLLEERHFVGVVWWKSFVLVMWYTGGVIFNWKTVAGCRVIMMQVFEERRKLRAVLADSWWPGRRNIQEICFQSNLLSLLCVSCSHNVFVFMKRKIAVPYLPLV